MTDYYRSGSVGISTGKQWLEEWSKKLDIGTICLFGGEPLMNKDLGSWISETRAHFPSSTIKIITNGTYLTLKNILPDLIAAGNAEYQISLHWRNGPKFNQIKKDLITQLTMYKGWKPINHNRPEVLLAFKRNDVTTQLAIFGEFVVPYKGHGSSMKPWNSTNIQDSYKNCGSPQNPILYNGRIYKCGPIANLRDALQLHNLLSDPEWVKFLSYQGYGPTDDIAELIDNFDKPHDICSMCSDCRSSAEIDHYAPGAVVEKKEIKWQN